MNEGRVVQTGRVLAVKDLRVEAGSHSWYAHVLLDNVDEVYGEPIDRGQAWEFGISRS